MLLIIPVIGIVLLKNLLISLRTRFRSSGHVAVLRSESTVPKDRRSLRVRRENANSSGTQFRKGVYLLKTERMKRKWRKFE